jgi:hypothetical protein
VSRRRSSGSSLVEALVGAALAAGALAGLATAAGLATRGLGLARDTSVALGLATERLETLRAGPRGDGGDTVVSGTGTVFERRWSVRGGRGEPVRLTVAVGWAGREVTVETEAFP